MPEKYGMPSADLSDEPLGYISHESKIYEALGLLRREVFGC